MSVARLLEAEPRGVFTDPEVQCSARRLTGVLDHRIVEEDVSADGDSSASVVTTAHGQRWTHDPFDRLIASQALAAGAQLINVVVVG